MTQADHEASNERRAIDAVNATLAKHLADHIRDKQEHTGPGLVYTGFDYSIVTAALDAVCDAERAKWVAMVREYVAGYSDGIAQNKGTVRYELQAKRAAILHFAQRMGVVLP
jgi:hypothetical protein